MPDDLDHQQHQDTEDLHRIHPAHSGYHSAEKTCKTHACYCKDRLKDGHLGQNCHDNCGKAQDNGNQNHSAHGES